MNDDQTGITYEKGLLYDISLDLLQPDPGQPRKSIDAQGLEDISASIAKLGVLQPILFRVNAEGILIIVAGERRTTAARAAGLTSIPALYVADANFAEVALVENLLRQDLTAIEESEAIQRLMNDQKYTQEQMGVIVGKERTTVSEILNLNKLPQEIRDECRGDRQISRQTLVVISRKKQERAMVAAFNKYKASLLKEKIVRPKADPNAPLVLLDMITAILVKIRSVDRSAWTVQETNDYHDALNGLKVEIEYRITATEAGKQE
jgi:ParB family transcriptional regulator, chromosome partitioning protein